MPNNARNKLRNMGGIMASSPKLMQASQGYQAGGPVYSGAPVDPIAGRQRDIQRFGIGYPDWQEMSRGERKDLGYPVSTIGGQMHFNRLGVGMGLTDPETRFNPYGEAPYQIDQTTSDVRETEPPIDEFLALDDMSRLPTVNVGNVPYLYDPATERVFRQDGSAVTPEEQATAKRFIAQSPEAQTQIIAPRLASEQLLERTETLAQRRLEEARQTGTDEDIAAARAELEEAQTARATPQRPPEPAETEKLPKRETPPLDDLRVPEDLFDRVQTALQEDDRLGPQPGPDSGAEDDPDVDTDTDTDGGDGPPPPPPEPTKKDLRGRYKEKIELFKEIYGEDDEDRARDRMMSLAMLGLAIASGQSPDALTNIAQGAAVGLQGMSEQERARREQEQGLQTLALESAMGEMSAEQQAEARMAEKVFDRNTRLAVAGIGNAGGYSKLKNPRAAFDATLQGLREMSNEPTSPLYGASEDRLRQLALEQTQITYGNVPELEGIGQRMGPVANPALSPEEAEAEANKLLE